MVAVMQTNVNFDLETELKAHLNYFIQQNNLPADFLLKQNPQIDREFEVSEKSWIARATPKVPAKVIVKASVRYWEDSTINGIEDTDSGDRTPCKNGDLWCPVINVATGIIENWEIGKTASIHFKVADGCGWELVDSIGNTIKSQDDGYVPKTLCPAENGYGDYIIMNIDEKGQIEKWRFDIDDFLEDE